MEKCLISGVEDEKGWWLSSFQAVGFEITIYLAYKRVHLLPIRLKYTEIICIGILVGFRRKLKITELIKLCARYLIQIYWRKYVEKI